MEIEKITAGEAKRRIRQASRAHETGYHVQHIDWFTEQTGFTQTNNGLNLQEDYPDCDCVLTSMDLHWRNKKSIVAVVIKEENDDLSLKKWTENFYTEKYQKYLEENQHILDQEQQR